MKTKNVYTEVRNKIHKCEVFKETEVSFQLICYLDYSEPISVIRVKSECFTSKKKAKEYFSKHAA